MAVKASAPKAEPQADPLICNDTDPACPDCGGTGERVRECVACHNMTMRSLLTTGTYSGRPIIGRKCDHCGHVEPPTYLR